MSKKTCRGRRDDYKKPSRIKDGKRKHKRTPARPISLPKLRPIEGSTRPKYPDKNFENAEEAM